MARKRYKREEKKKELKPGELGPKSRKTTVQVKRAWKASKSKLSLKAWARQENSELSLQWLSNKGASL